MKVLGDMVFVVDYVVVYVLFKKSVVVLSLGG